jgi:uncharacterized protein (TIGR02186 family)
MTGYGAWLGAVRQLTLGLAVLLLAMPAMAAPSRLVADLSDSHVDITSSYHGTELILFGAYEGAPGDDLVLIVEGPATDIAQRRKEKKAGIWVNGETLVWQQAPSFYHVFATDDLAAIADKDALSKADVGPLARGLMLVAGEAQGSNGHGGGALATTGAVTAGTAAQQAGLSRNMNNNGLWQLQPALISTQQDMLFRAQLSLPSNVPTGDYLVRVLHFRDGVAISEKTTDMNIRKAGLSALIYRFAHEYSVFYGLFAIVFAVASGWLAAVAFRRG